MVVMSARMVASDIMMIGCELGSLSLMLRVPKPGVQIKDMVLTRLSYGILAYKN